MARGVRRPRRAHCRDRERDRRRRDPGLVPGAPRARVAGGAGERDVDHRDMAGVSGWVGRVPTRDRAIKSTSSASSRRSPWSAPLQGPCCFSSPRATRSAERHRTSCFSHAVCSPLQPVLAKRLDACGRTAADDFSHRAGSSSRVSTARTSGQDSGVLLLAILGIAIPDKLVRTSGLRSSHVARGEHDCGDRLLHRRSRGVERRGSPRSVESGRAATPGPRFARQGPDGPSSSPHHPDRSGRRCAPARRLRQTRSVR